MILCRIYNEAFMVDTRSSTKRCSTLLGVNEVVQSSSEESGDFEGDFVFEDMSDSDSLASVEIELVGSEDATGSKSSSETDKKRNDMADTSKGEDGDSLASVEMTTPKAESVASTQPEGGDSQVLERVAWVSSSFRHPDVKSIAVQ